MPKFQDIPQFTRTASYAVDIPWSFLEDSLRRYLDEGLNLDPDFQRAHVWTEEQQVRYVEFRLRGGRSGHDIFTNCPGWNYGERGSEFVLVDGKQRLEAARKFLRNELRIFGGNLFKDYGDRLPMMEARFRWHVNDLDTRAEVLQWYLDLNTGGVVHTQDELDRVRELLEAELANPRPEDVARKLRRAKQEAEDKKRRAAKKGR
jgi:hypothetical protein